MPLAVIWGKLYVLRKETLENTIVLKKGGEELVHGRDRIVVLKDDHFTFWKSIHNQRPLSVLTRKNGHPDEDEVS